MITLLTCCLAISASRQQGQGDIIARKYLDMPKGSIGQLYYQENKSPLEPPRRSPKKFGESKTPWEFPFIVGGYAHINGESIARDLRFRVYSQEQRGGRAAQVTQMLLRLWEYNAERVGLGHNPRYLGGLVDVFLCFGGKAGGEQLLDVEIGPEPERRILDVNTIYIYDMPSFTDPVEMAREVAHEYGHATWPHFGEFKDPEEWADGYLSEKIYLRWIREGLAKKELVPDDVMGATIEGIDKWLAANVTPLVQKASVTQPTSALLADPSKAGMDAFIGLALYVEGLFPGQVFGRSIRLIGSPYAKDYPDAVVLAAEEPKSVTLRIPPQFIRKAIWIPLGTGQLTGAPILKKAANGWVQVQVGANPIVITNTRD